MFIHRGKIVKTATRDELASYTGQGGILKIVLQNITDDVVTYLKTLGGTIQVEGTSVTLSDFQGDSSQVNAELVKRGFSVREIKHEKSGLEEYFFDLIHRTEASR